MNFTLYILGNPNGYDQYPLDANKTRFHEVLSSCQTESQLSVFRNNQLIQYVYVRKIPGGNGLYLGFTLMVTGVYCTDCHALNDLFENTYYDVLLKGELLQYNKDKYSFLLSRFADNVDEIKRINRIFKIKLENEIGNLFQTIPTSFRTRNEPFTISLKESASYINSAIEQHSIVHIINNEKNVSELERTQRLLSEMYAKHQQLETEYKKVLNQKRNFKLVVILSLILACCVTGFFLLNDVLIDKNSRINALKKDVEKKEDQIESLYSDKQQLHSNIKKLNTIIQTNNNSIRRLNEQCDSLQTNIDNLQTKNSNLWTQIYELEDDKESLKRDLKLAKSAIGEIYEVYGYNKSYANLYYRKYDSKGRYEYYQNGAQYKDYTQVLVYSKQDGYALTAAGYLKVEDIRKKR